MLRHRAGVRHSIPDWLVLERWAREYSANMLKLFLNDAKPAARQIKEVVQSSPSFSFGVNESWHPGTDKYLSLATRAVLLSLLHEMHCARTAEKRGSRIMLILDLVGGLVAGDSPDRYNAPPEAFSAAVLSSFFQMVPVSSLCEKGIIVNDTILQSIIKVSNQAGNDVSCEELPELNAHLCRASNAAKPNQEDHCMPADVTLSTTMTVPADLGI